MLCYVIPQESWLEQANARSTYTKLLVIILLRDQPPEVGSVRSFYRTRSCSPCKVLYHYFVLFSNFRQYEVKKRTMSSIDTHVPFSNIPSFASHLCSNLISVPNSRRSRYRFCSPCKVLYHYSVIFRYLRQYKVKIATMTSNGTHFQISRPLLVIYAVILSRSRNPVVLVTDSVFTEISASGKHNTTISLPVFKTPSTLE